MRARDSRGVMVEAVMHDERSYGKRPEEKDWEFFDRVNRKILEVRAAFEMNFERTMIRVKVAYDSERTRAKITSTLVEGRIDLDHIDRDDLELRNKVIEEHFSEMREQFTAMK